MASINVENVSNFTKNDEAYRQFRFLSGNAVLDIKTSAFLYVYITLILCMHFTSLVKKICINM